MNKIFARLFAVLSLTLLFAVTAPPATAQETAQTVLRPPKGSQVAIVVFEDLECPMCRRTAPLVEEASKTYKIPLIRHDFPLPMHPWSYQAAVMARYFDTHSKALGNEFRDYIFQNQLEIDAQNLRGYAEKFAAAHKVDFPSRNRRPRLAPIAIRMAISPVRATPRARSKLVKFAHAIRRTNPESARTDAASTPTSARSSSKIARSAGTAVRPDDGVPGWDVWPMTLARAALN